MGQASLYGQYIYSFLHAMFTSTELTVPVILLRLSFGLILGSIVGIEREMKNQAAGLRTHALICLGATMLMLLSIYMPQQYGVIGGDPGRIAAQVVSGIGFLGAGAIVRLGLDIKGLTTAASIWVIAALGLLSGAGMYITAIVATLFMLFILRFLDDVSNRWFPKALPRRIIVIGEGLQQQAVKVRQTIQSLGVVVHGFSIEYHIKKEGSTMSIDVGMPQYLSPEELLGSLSNLPGIKRVSIELTG